MITDSYINYITSVRRYSPRTREIYREILDGFVDYSCGPDASDEDVCKALNPVALRNYEVHLMDECGLGARTVNQHLSVLSGFGRYLMKEGLVESNAARSVSRPKVEKRLPEFFRESSMKEYFEKTDYYASEENTDWEKRMRRLVISILYGTGIRRAELIGMNVSSVDFSRNVIHVLGKGDKMREIPIISSLSHEIYLYLQATESMMGERTAEDPLLVTEKGRRLYPMAVQRIISQELGAVDSISGKKSPHMLRHTLATELLDNGADLNSIKELLGHSSLAATQVYTHNSIEKLKQVYNRAHPRAKRGGNNGD